MEDNGISKADKALARSDNAIESINSRILLLEAVVAELRIAEQKARKWNGPDLDTKEAK